MFEKFTEKAIKVVMLAQEEARRLGHNFVGTEVLLLGLIGENSGIAAKTLSQLGINLKQARREVKGLVGRGPGYRATEIPFTERAKEGLELAADISHRINVQNIDTEQLLLGILGVEDAVANTVLQNLGVELSALRRLLLQSVGLVDENGTFVANTDSSLDLLDQLGAFINRLSGTLSEAREIRRQLKQHLSLSINPNVHPNDLTAIAQALTRQLDELPDRLDSQQPGLKACLNELQTAILNSAELSAIDKVQALEQIHIFAKAKRKPLDSAAQNLVRLAIKVLRGTLADLPLESSLVDIGNRCLPIMAQTFDLN